MLKIILDTNVLINADRGTHSYPARIMQAVLDGKIEAYSSHKIRRENHLIKKRILNDPEMHDLIERFLDTTTDVRPTNYFDAVETDHEDDKYVDAAVEAGADYIITNDYDLLNIGHFENTRMVRPEEFWKIFENSEDPDGKEAWQSWMSGLLNND